jgi:hypothetical protein
MGRIKGSKNKPKSDPDQKVSPKSDNEIKQECAEISREANEKFPEIFILKGRQKEYIAVRKDIIPETPYPSNWGEMGKVDRLKWLTANRQK